RCQQLPLAYCFHAFGDDSKVQIVGQTDNGLHDGIVFSIHRLHERLVDLQGINWKTTEITQRAVSGAKIIDAQINSQRSQLRHRFTGASDIVHLYTLGELDHYASRLDCTLLQCVFNVPNKTAVREVLCADVRGDVKDIFPARLEGEGISLPSSPLCVRRGVGSCRGSCMVPSRLHPY